MGMKGELIMKGNIFEVKSLEELKGMGKLAEVREAFKEAVAEMGIKGKTNSWQNMYESIQQVRKTTEKLVKLTGYATGSAPRDGASVDSPDPFFKGEAERYIFILTQTDGEARMNLLGADMRHYSDPKLASQWMRGISKLIHPDNCKHPMAAQASAKLDELYKVMVGK
jgi:hypothetical protein